MGRLGRVSLRDLMSPPNLATLARLALVPAVILLMARDGRGAALVVLLIMFATDGLDGYLARRLGRVTELGKVLDPLADKLAVGAVLLYLTVVGEFPLWAFALIALRDVAVGIGGIGLSMRRGTVPSALPVGKVTLVVLAMMTGAFVADVEVLEFPLMTAGLFMVVCSGIVYARAMYRGLTSVGAADAGGR